MTGDDYTRPAVTVQLTTRERMFALRVLRAAGVPWRTRRLIAADTLWAFEASHLADALDQASTKTRPLSHTRRQTRRLAAHYRAAAGTAKRAPINPAEWPEAPRTRSVPIETLIEQTATAHWAAIPPSPEVTP